MAGPRLRSNDIPSMSEQRTQQQENDAIEQMKRDALQNAWVNRAFNEAYFKKHKDWMPMNWVNITDSKFNKPIDEDTPEARDVIRLYAGNDPIRIFPPGDYHYGDPNKVKKGEELIIHIGKDGYMYQVPRKAFTEKSFAATLDLAVAAKNIKSVELEMPYGHAIRQGEPVAGWRLEYNLQQLNKSMLIAIDRGLAVTFSENTEALIHSLPEKEQLKIRRAAELSQINSAKSSVMLGKSFNDEFNTLAKKIDDKKADDKLHDIDTTAADGGLQAVKDKLYGAGAVLNTDQKLEKIDEQVKQIQERAQELQNVAKKLLGGVEAQNKLLEDPSALMSTTEKGMSSWNQLKNSMNKKFNLNLDVDVKLKNREGKFADPTGVVSQIRDQNDACKVNRDKLLTSINEELGRLTKAEGLLRKELDALKADHAATDAQKAAIDEQLKSITTEKKGLEETKKVLDKAREGNNNMPAAIQAAEAKAEQQKQQALAPRT